MRVKAMWRLHPLDTISAPTVIYLEHNQSERQGIMSENQQTLHSMSEGAKQAAEPNAGAPSASTPPPSAESLRSPWDIPLTAEELKEDARAERAYQRQHRQRVKAREEAIKRGDVAAALDAVLGNLIDPTDTDLLGGEVRDAVERALIVAYDQGGFLQMAEAALKPGLLVLGQTIASCAALIQRNSAFEVTPGSERLRGETNQYLAALETASTALVKLVKTMATAKHAAQLAADQTDGELPWQQTRNTRLSGKRCPSRA